jgi:hypothetical protein
MRDWRVRRLLTRYVTEVSKLLTKLLHHYHSDAFCLFYDAKTKTVKALNGSGRAPEKLSVRYLRSRGITEGIPTTDLNSVTVPGS